MEVFEKYERQRIFELDIPSENKPTLSTLYPRDPVKNQTSKNVPNTVLDSHSSIKSSFDFQADPHSQTKSIPKQNPLAQDASIKHKKSVPINIFYLVKNAQILLEHAETALALNLLTRAIMQEPQNPYVIRWLGFGLEKSGELGQALKCYQQWTHLEPNEHSYFSLAQVQYQLGLNEEALQNYFEALSFVKSEDHFLLLEIYKTIGNIYVRSGDFESAEEHYNRAFTQSPGSDLLLVNYGTLEIQRSQWERAIFRFREALERNKKNEKAWIGLAMVNRHLGDFELAWGNLERALDVNPQNPTALELLAQWTLQDAQYEKGIYFLVQYLEQNSLDCKMSFYLSQIFCAAGRLKDALLELERTVCLNPQESLAYSLMERVKINLYSSNQAA